MSINHLKIELSVKVTKTMTALDLPERQFQEPLSPGHEFVRALDLSGIDLNISIRESLLDYNDSIYKVSLDAPTAVHQAYRNTTARMFAEPGAPSPKGEINEEFTYRLSPEALALAHLMGLIRAEQSADVPNFTQRTRRSEGLSRPYTCADAELRFYNVADALKGKIFRREPVDRVDIVLDKKREPLFIKKYVDQQSALSLQDVLFRGRLVPAGTLFDLRLDVAGINSTENAERAIPIEDSKAVAFVYPHEAVQTVFPLRLSMWFHRTPEERARFTYSKKIDDPSRKELVATELSDFSDAVSKVISTQ